LRRTRLQPALGAALLLLASAWGATHGRRGIASSPTAAPDPCALLSPAEVAAVQGTPLVAAVPSAAGTLRTCLYRTRDPGRSVSLALAASDPQPGLSARQLWRRQFHPASPPDEDEKHAAQPVAGLGDEAFWINTPAAGALYVLRGPVFFRLSLGGLRDAKPRLERSKGLARQILLRLEARSTR